MVTGRGEESPAENLHSARDHNGEDDHHFDDDEVYNDDDHRHDFDDNVDDEGEEDSEDTNCDGYCMVSTQEKTLKC